MPRKIVTGCLYIFILLISFEFILPAFSHDSPTKPFETSVHNEHHKAFFISSIYEKTEEERTEEEREKLLSVELADFSQLATLLSKSHTPHTPTRWDNHFCEQQPPLFKLFCVYLI